MPVELFRADDGVHGQELWRTDGTAAGTWLVKDINPGSNDSSPDQLTTAGGLVYFAAQTTVGNTTYTNLWRSDGTANGTVALTSGNAGSFPGALIAVDQYLYFYAQNAQGGHSLYITDGTAAGTRELAAVENAADFTVVDHKLMFTAFDAAHGSELWISDGTAAGTRMAQDLNPGAAGSNPSGLVQLGAWAVFAANDGVHGTELFLSGPGTNQISLTRDIYTSGSALPHGMTAAGGKVFFAVTNDNQGGNALWVTSGYAGTTVRLAGNLASTGLVFAAAGDKLYYRTADGALHVTDGSLAGTSSVGVFSNFVGVKAVGAGGGAVFDAYETGLGEGVYVTDGTAAGTSRVASATMTGQALQIGGKLYFTAFDQAHGSELWVSDGTVAGTHMVTDIIGGTASSDPYAFAEFDGQLIFRARNDAINGELWISDGTAAGTHMVKDIWPEDHSGYLNAAYAMAFGGKVLFQTGYNNSDLQVSDGTAAGTGLLAALPAGSLSFTRQITIGGGKAYFVANAGSDMGELWVSGGVAGDAVDLTTAASGFGANPGADHLTMLGGKLYFTAFDAAAHIGLFSTDGTVAGTTFVATIVANSQPVAWNGKLLFQGYTDGAGAGLYVTDGTAGGAHLLLATSSAGQLTPSGSGLFFVVSDNLHGVELWVTDGTAAGTHLTKDIAPGLTFSMPTGVTATPTGVIFSANDVAHGAEVWVSDGTAGGTHSLGDLNPTMDKSTWLQTYGAAVAFGGKVYFDANDGLSGEGLWVSDGTAAGTHRLISQPAGSQGQVVTDITVLGSHLLFHNGGALWVTDGTAAGTTSLSTTIRPLDYAASAIVGNQLFFAGDEGPDNVNRVTGLFVTDGTAAGTSRISDQSAPALMAAGDKVVYFSSDSANTGLFAYSASAHTTTFLAAVGAPGFSYNAFGVSAGGKIFFAGHDFVHGTELWVTDGSVAGTARLTEIGPASVDAQLSNFTAVGGSLYFTAAYSGLWVSDGTAAGTSLIGSLTVTGPIVQLGSKLYFAGDDGVAGRELWSYDTSAHSLSMVADIRAGASGSSPAGLTVLAGDLYFTASNTVQNSSAGWAELYRLHNGTLSVVSTTANGAQGHDFNVIGAKLVYFGSDSSHGTGLFSIDNAAASPTFLASFGVTNTTLYTVSGSTLFFLGLDNTNGLELWATDGSVAGTRQLTDTGTANGSAASGFTVAGSQIFFSATDGVHGQELWVTDGTAAGSHQVADLNSGAAGSAPASLTAIGGTLYFVATTTSGANELFRSDGTAAGTVALTSAVNGENVQYLTNTGGKLFFYGSDSVHGAGLFVSDGTAGGTSFLKSISLPGNFVGADGTLYFSAYDDVNKTELWKSDGTAAGTVRVTDTTINQGSYPANFATLRDFDPPAHDLDANGVDDVLWRNDSGELYFYTMESAGGWNSGSLGFVPTDWHVVDTSDYTGDGRADVLWRNNSGDLYVWTSVGGPGVHFAGQSISHVDNAWHAVGQAGDFNGDGRADILWRNDSGEVYLWNSNTGADVSFVGQSLGAVGNDWHIQGVADFNGDGRADVLWRQDGGDTYVWLDSASGPVAMGGQSISSTPNDWQIQGVGDFNGDGRADVLWRHDDGELYVWNSRTDSAAVNFLGQSLGMVDLSWSVAAIGDYDGDGRADILFTNGVTTYGWFSNGSSGPETFFGRALGNVTHDWHILSDFHGM